MANNPSTGPDEETLPSDHSPWIPGLTPAVTGMNMVGAVVVLAMAVIVNVDVLGRWLFNAPLDGAVELTEMGIVAIVYLQLAHAVAVGKLTRSEMLLELTERRLPRLNLALRLAFNLMGAFVLAVIVYGQVPRLISAWENGFYKGNPGIFRAPMWPLEAILLIGAAFALVQFLVLAWRNAGLMRDLGRARP
ncbi:TRAP transporter small permease subunit [Amorphus orientalis]|uniref:TRAP transporter small permease protein n=1 Tax=Amorphus orientalis TaxID=649198 RepID=A0AAE4AST8_9HYPH|nr:TRAP transporter small permease [Amorphus orientalis]MDQ0314324.1 TRAP-type mannitol/chloroaromatic compound transport system permease small subunit [Amorphus orientalis]